MWTALQFDNAVMVFGRWVEGKLNEFQDGKPLHTLRDLLDMPLTMQEKRDQNRASIAGLKALAGKRGSGVQGVRAKRKVS